MDKENRFHKLMRISNRIAVVKRRCLINHILSDKIKTDKTITHEKCVKMNEVIGKQVNDLFW
jgi:hypothetical protein